MRVPNNSYDAAQVCLNGHKINARTRSQPEHNAKFCSRCGEKTVVACPECKADIRGDFCLDGGWGRWRQGWLIPLSHCHGCGKPYPWTQRRAGALAEAIDAVEELVDEEKDRLKKSIPDITADTPRSGTATLLFKKAITKIGAVGSKVLTDVITKVATEAVKQQMGLP